MHDKTRVRTICPMVDIAIVHTICTILDALVIEFGATIKKMTEDEQK